MNENQVGTIIVNFAAHLPDHQVRRAWFGFAGYSYCGTQEQLLTYLEFINGQL